MNSNLRRDSLAVQRSTERYSRNEYVKGIEALDGLCSQGTLRKHNLFLLLTFNFNSR